MRKSLFPVFRLFIFVCVCLIGLSCSSDTAPPFVVNGQDFPPQDELYSAQEREAIISAARSIIESDPTAALVSVDSEGRPRVRSVNTSKPDSAMSIWIATRPGTRKVEQIRSNPNVALYYNVDQEISYLSIMGTAFLHDDHGTIEVKNPFNEQWTKQFFPNYPDDILLIEIRPTWLEVMGQGIAASEDDWRPQAVMF